MKKPDIILFTSDGMRLDSLGCMGNRAAWTPHMDALVRDGVAFRNVIPFILQVIQQDIRSSHQIFIADADDLCLIVLFIFIQEKGTVETDGIHQCNQQRDKKTKGSQDRTGLNEYLFH